jgi:hypothetical protein
MCGTENALSAETCKECGARLTPLRVGEEEIPPEEVEIGEAAGPEEPVEDRAPEEQSSLEGEPAEEPVEDEGSWLDRLRGTLGAEEDVGSAAETTAPEEAPVVEGPEEPAETSEPEAEAEVPEWIGDLGEKGEEEKARLAEISEVDEEGSAELPAWLEKMIAEDETSEADQSQVGQEKVEQEEPAPFEEEATANIPPWLQELVSEEDEAWQDNTPEEAIQAEEVEPSEAERPKEAGEAEEPAWLAGDEEADISDLDQVLWDETFEESEEEGVSEVDQDWEPAWPETVGETEEQALPAPEAEAPAADAPAADAEIEKAPEAGEEEEEILPESDEFILESVEPDWVRETSDAGVSAPAEESAAEEIGGPEKAEEIPDWLRGLTIEEEAPPTEDEEYVGLETASPEVLSEQEAAEIEAPLEPEWEQEVEEMSEADIPDWLQDLAPAAAQPPESEEEVPGELAEADIPDWLQAMRPTSAVPEEIQGTKEVGKGVLAGITGVLPLESLWEQPRRAEPTPRTPTASGSEAVDLFADILVGQPEERPVRSGLERPGFFARDLTRILLYLLLALAVILPLFLGRNWFSTTLTVSDATWDLYDAVNALDSGDVAMMVFDYDLSTAAELDLQARAIMEHVLGQGASVLTASLVPQGPALAQATWESLSEAGDYVYGEDYLNLGYIAGQRAAVHMLTQRSLAQVFQRDFRNRRTLGEYAVIQDVERLSQVDLIIVLAADQITMRYWIEQVQAQIEAPLKMGAGLAALSGPSILPYYDSGQLVGMIVGMIGAAEYEVATNAPGVAVSNLTAQSLGHLVIIFVIVLANVAALISRRQRA